MTLIKTLDEKLLAGIASGTWVAISSNQERVVGTGNTIDEALQKAKENGETNPFIIGIPPDNAALIL